jgi:hypothetical protein
MKVQPTISTKLNGSSKEFGVNNIMPAVDGSPDVLFKSMTRIENNKIDEEAPEAENYFRGNDWITLAKWLILVRGSTNNE